MSTEREMTLDEWCAKLSPSHAANRELADLRSALAARDSVIAEKERELLKALRQRNDEARFRQGAEAQYGECQAKLAQAMAALEQIREGRGPFNHDQYQFAVDTIAAMKKLADDALRGAGDERSGGEVHNDHPLRHYDRTCPACNQPAPDRPNATGLSAN